MPDGENRENQSPQPPKRSLKDFFNKRPVEPRITEPDPDYVLGSAPKPIAPEEAQKAMFRETAKKLAAEEEEILVIAGKVNSAKASSRLPSGFHIRQWGEGLLIGSWAENVMDPLDLSRSEVRVSLSKGNANFDQFTRGFVNSDISLEVSTHTDGLTMSQVQEIERREPGTTHSYTFYLFDSHGSYKKINIVSDDIDVDEKRIIRRFHDRLQFASQMTPEDFELAGSLLDGMKQKLLVALGKTPPEPQEQ